MNQETTELQRLQFQAEELMDMIEDTVEHYCDEYVVSGEQAWVMIRQLANCELAQFPGHEHHLPEAYHEEEED